MAGIIILSALVSGTNADILQGTRLQSIPASGILTFELSCSDATTTNNYVVTIQLPGGDTPLNSVLVPQATITAGILGVIDERTDLQASFPITQGGHCVFSVVETGDAEFMYRVTYTPQAPAF